MGKSNRFDYHARPNAGTKLGELIGRDLEKEADKTLKDAEKQAAKARKRSTSSADSGSFFNEAIVHHLDIKVPSKQLGDDGAIAMADGLKRALQNGTQEACVVLEDLDLSGNAITTAALERLAPAIKLAKHSVKTLNLSNNAIKVETDQEAKQWQTFLCSFKDCGQMQRLDLSGNRLGSRGLEVFAQICSKELPIEHMSASDHVSVLSLSDLSGSAQPTPTAANFTDPMSDASHLKRGRGLRAIPCITLNNVGLDDAGALWLSYIIEEHEGIDWDQNEPDLGKDGVQVLRRAEAVRQQPLPADADDDALSRAVDARAAQINRRASTRSVASDDMSDLESSRKKVQRTIIEKHGLSYSELWRLSCSELWHAGLHIFLTARAVVGIGPGPRSSIYTGPSNFDSIARPVTPANRSIPKLCSPIETSRHGTYAATLTASTDEVAGAPSMAITEVTNTPTTPRMVFKPHRKGGMSEGSDLTSINQRLSELQCIERDDNPMRFVRYQQSKGGDNCYRDTAVPSHLPASVMEKVALNAVDSWEQQLLTERQRDQCIQWGLSLSNVEIERGWHKMADSAQALTLLERIGCLKYERD